MTDLVLLERDGEIAKVTLNQPAKLNAVNNRMWTRLREIFTDLDGEEDLRCIVLAGAGERAFSVGADISEFEENRSTIEKARQYHDRTHAAMQAILCCRHPVIAQIRGLCVGGALELTTTCDLRICGESARFGIPVKRLGLVVSYAELKPLVDLIGPANALEILLEGRIHGAADALRMGLVNRVVADAEVEPLAARWHKKFTRRIVQPEPLSDDEMAESFHCFETEDFRAGYRAFLAKTMPEFRGR
jgi:enoyl-CoA hydratase